MTPGSSAHSTRRFHRQQGPVTTAREILRAPPSRKRRAGGRIRSLRVWIQILGPNRPSAGSQTGWADDVRPGPPTALGPNREQSETELHATHDDLMVATFDDPRQADDQSRPSTPSDYPRTATPHSAFFVRRQHRTPANWVTPGPCPAKTARDKRHAAHFRPQNDQSARHGKTGRASALRSILTSWVVPRRCRELPRCDVGAPQLGAAQSSPHPRAATPK